MRVAALSLRDFRSHSRTSIELGDCLTVIVGPNGSGKTNLIEALYFGITGRSCRTSSDRRVIGYQQPAARVEVELVDAIGSNRLLTSAIDRSGNRETLLDGTPISVSDTNFKRPLVSVFLPDRMSLVTGSPGGRRSHLDNLATALKITDPNLRGNYSKALIQRNALLAKARGSGSVAPTISAWNKSLAQLGSELVSARQQAIDMVTGATTEIAVQLGLAGHLVVEHRSGGSPDISEFESRLESDLQSDIERGYTHFGPHRGDFVFKRDGRDIKEHGSQGEKRIALLSLILAEREVIAQAQGSWPLLLLDDVMSELDAKRRELLVDRVVGSGQCLITATEAEHVPCEIGSGVQMIVFEQPDRPDLRAA